MRASELAKIWSHDTSETDKSLKYDKNFASRHLHLGEQFMQFIWKDEMRWWEYMWKVSAKRLWR